MIQIATQVFPVFNLPNWAAQLSSRLSSKLSSTIAGRTRQQSVLGMDSLMWSTTNNLTCCMQQRFMQHWSMSTSTRRAREYRERMRLRGYRPVQVWVPDVRSAAFAAEAHREALALADADRHSDDMEFVEAISALGSLHDHA